MVLSAVNAQLCTHDSQRVFLPLSLSFSILTRFAVRLVRLCAKPTRFAVYTDTRRRFGTTFQNTISVFGFLFSQLTELDVSGVLVLLFWFRFLRLAGFSFVQPFYKTT